MFSFLCVLGSSLFALGSHFKGTPYLLPLMLTGRLVFGSGNGSLTSKANSQNPWFSNPVSLTLSLVHVSCPEPDHSLLVQREGAGSGIWIDSGFLSTGIGLELLPHPEVRRQIWHAVDTVGR